MEATPAGERRVTPREQAARDADARAVLQAERDREAARLQELLRAPHPRAADPAHVRSIERSRSDLAAIQRELERLGGRAQRDLPGNR